mmetsp:Transcript_35242/g.72150  ORF Transcript_35242/g.72150 Transcript_35242/m.72150 type:complete len:90 (-) Transcript_35242:91-360(-)
MRSKNSRAEHPILVYESGCSEAIMSHCGKHQCSWKGRPRETQLIDTLLDVVDQFGMALPSSVRHLRCWSYAKKLIPGAKSKHHKESESV